MKPILEVQSISKKFIIGKSRVPYKTITGVLSDLLYNSKKQYSDFWALSNISFNLSEGETLGIIGKNGAGKSTLLKILSKITPPTSGKIICRGRIASLLEVGTGFHGELSGRENIYLNGALLGMKQKEIKEKFDAIIDFSGVEQFIDTPLKHFSSGMQLRLAFAVAAFLEPEILIIDEVLAVGDADFQKKCLSKMSEVSKSGRTILFVSHNLNALQSICTKGLVIENGILKKEGSINEALEYYNNNIGTNASKIKYAIYEMPGDDFIKIESIQVVNQYHENTGIIDLKNKIGIEVIYQLINSTHTIYPNFHIYKSTGECAFVGIHEQDIKLEKAGKIKTTMWIPNELLNTGIYTANIAFTNLLNNNVHVHIVDTLKFEICENINNRNHPYTGNLPGVTRPKLMWETINL